MATSHQEDDTSREDVLLLFDVDGTLTPARQDISKEMNQFLQGLRKKVTVGLVGGSDIHKIAQQTLPPDLRVLKFNLDSFQSCIDRFDYVFAENGLVAYRQGKLLAKQSLKTYLGDDKSQRFINFCLGYMSNLVLPLKRGNFIEFRNGLINVCPVGRSCSQEERDQFEQYDKEHNVRKKFIEELNNKFGPESTDPLGLKFSIGGQISFDVFPEGWDKTYCLNLVDKTHKIIHFFGDKTQPGGNDYEIYSDSRTIGHSVQNPAETLALLSKLDFQ